MNPDSEASLHQNPSNNNDHYLSLNIPNQQNAQGYPLLVDPEVQPQHQRPEKIKCFNRCRFSLKTFTFWITLLEIILFMITKHFGGTNADKTICVLYRFGAKYTPAILTYHHFHRLLLPMFLHANIAHIYGNALTQLMWGFRVEEALGTKRMIFLYIMGGIGGNVLSAVFGVTNIAVGASSSILGILGFALPYVIITAKDPKNDVTDHVFTFFTYLSLVDTLFIGQAGADNSAHRGGFIVGLLVAGLFIRGSSAMGFDKKNKIAMGSLILMALYFVVLSVVLLSLPDYHEKADETVEKCAKILGW